MSSRHQILVSIVTAFAGLAAVIACTSSPKTETTSEKPAAAASTTDSAEADPKAAWAVKMQSLSGALSDLLPLVVSKKKFDAPENFERIEADTRNLKGLVHSLGEGDKPSADPSLKVMSGLFADDIERALDSLRSGNRIYARQILKDTTSYCIQCHTQNNNGPNFPKLNLSINTADLNKVEQAEFFTATRQFDRALTAYIDALKDDALAKADPFAWEQAARSALAILTRVKNDPKEAQTLLEKIEAQSSLPESTKKALVSWKKSVQEWAKEKRPKAQKPEDQVKRAESLIAQAQKHQEFPLDHSQDIVFFRASSLLHDFLSARPGDDRLQAKALYLAGAAAEATRDMNFWTLHENYYEQCIRLYPHSKQAEQCFERLKDSITLGYSGSSGINIPPEVSRRLEGYREAALPKKDGPQSH